MPADVSGIIKYDSCILYRFGRCELLPFQKLYTLMLWVKIKWTSYIYMYTEAYILMLTLSGNCATNCELQLQLAHLQ